MKVYCFKPNGGYQGGCVVVAANSPLEALGAIHANSHFDSEFTDLEHCVEVTSLTANVEKPEVIISAFYIE